MLNSLEKFIVLAKKKLKKRIVVAVAEDIHTLESIKWIIEKNLGTATLIGNRKKITHIANKLNFNIVSTEIIDIQNQTKACMKAVSLIRQGEADILMKGLVNSSIYLRAILDKDLGIRRSKLITQMAFVQSPFCNKLFALTDSGINIKPSLDDKIIMINQSVEIFNRLGVEYPKIAVISAQENICESIPGSLDAAALSIMNQRKLITGCIIEGPLSIDLAFNHQSCEYKRINTEVGGNADLIVFPDINCANIFYKTLTYFGSANIASFITGTTSPVVFTSRTDTAKTKYFSIACAIAQCDN